MSEQPEALRLADILQHKLPSVECLEKAAAELRRLHAINAKLLGTLKEIGEFASEPWVSSAARAAIAKAEGVKP